MGVPLAALSIAPSTAATAPVGKSQVAQVAQVAQVSQAAQAAPSQTAASRQNDVAAADDAANQQAIADGVDADVSRATAGSPPDGDDRRRPGRRESIDVDQLIGMRAVGVAADYQQAMAEAGFPDLTAGQLTGARAVGMTPDYVRAMHAAGMRASFDDMVGARATGLDPTYIAAMRQLGVSGSFDDFQGMRAVGVTPAYVRCLRAKGIDVTAPDKLMALRAVGFDRDP